MVSEDSISDEEVFPAGSEVDIGTAKSSSEFVPGREPPTGFQALELSFFLNFRWIFIFAKVYNHFWKIVHTF